MKNKDWIKHSNLGFQIITTLALFGGIGYFLDNIYPADLAILRQVSGVIGSILTFERIPSVPNNLTIWPFI